MRDGRAEALEATIAERMRIDATLRRAYADLRETCAYAIDPRTADRDLARLIARYRASEQAETPVGPRFQAVLGRVPGFEEEPGGRSGEDPHPAFPLGGGTLFRSGIDMLLREHLGLRLDHTRSLDPWAGEGEIAHALEARETHANEADPLRYATLVERVGKGAVLADSFRLPERRPTPGFDFCDDENAARVNDEQALPFAVIASDLRFATRADTRASRRVKETWGESKWPFAACVRWMADRLEAKGVIAFVSDVPFVDEPGFASLRAGLAKEFGFIAHLALPQGMGITFLLRGAGGGRALYAEAETVPESFESTEWHELHPTPTHVWRTEILREEWAGFTPLVKERGAILSAVHAGMVDGMDALAPTPKARRVLRHPFVPVWRTFDRKARREPPPVEGPTIVLFGEPFGVLASALPIDRRLGGTKSPVLAAGGRISAEALRRFRTAYGAPVTERDVLDAALALLHHPEYRLRYHEDLRRGVPRLHLPDEELLAALEGVPDAPPVGPGTAFRTGWLAEALFEPGTVPDYDDPFASPYARADVEPGFLLLVGLGAALYRIQADFERLRPFPLEVVGEPAPIERMRLQAGRTRLALTRTWLLEGVPPEAFEYRFGRLSAPEWVVEGLRARTGFDPNLPDDPERPARLFAQAVTASLETRRLTGILATIRL